MSQFISDSQTSPLGGLFSLKASNGEGAEVLSGTGFKLALNDVESSASLQRQPLGLAVAATALPLGKELPPELQVLAEGVLTNVELEQLNFAAQAMGLKLPQVLQDKFANGTYLEEPASDQIELLPSEDISTDDSDVVENNLVAALNSALIEEDGSSPPNPQVINEADGEKHLEGNEAVMLVAASPADHPTQAMAERATMIAMEEQIDNDGLRGEPISMQTSNRIQPDRSALEDIIPAFVEQWLDSDVEVIQPVESDTKTDAVVATTLAALIEENPDPANWHAIKIVMPDDASPVVGGDIPTRESSLLQLAKELAQATASSDDFISALARRTRQPEALAQQLLRHFTAQMKSEMEPSAAMVKEGTANELAASNRLAPEGLKFMQSLLDDAPVKDRVPTPSIDTATMVSPSHAANQRNVAVENAVQARIENVPVNPHRAEFQQQMEQRIQWMMARGMQSADIRIDPPELGTIHIRVAQHGDQTQVVFTSQHANVREALENALPRLREMFEQQGLTLAQTDVRDQGGQSRSGEQETGSNESAALNASSQDEEAVVVTRRVGLVDTHV